MEMFLMGPNGEQVDAETALAAMEANLLQIDKNTQSTQWGQMHQGVAQKYFERVIGDRAANVDRSIWHSQQCLEVFSQDANPREWAAIQKDLSTVYHARTTGDFQDNLDHVIDHATKALSVWKFEEFPQNWVQCTTNLADAYKQSSRGDLYANIERVIELSTSALRVHTKETVLFDWVMQLATLAWAYRERKTGDHRANIDKAIKFSRDALKEISPSHFKIGWDEHHTQLQLCEQAIMNKVNAEMRNNKYSAEDLKAMPVKKLKLVMKLRNISSATFTEKQELVDAIMTEAKTQQAQVEQEQEKNKNKRRNVNKKKNKKKKDKEVVVEQATEAGDGSSLMELLSVVD